MYKTIWNIITILNIKKYLEIIIFLGLLKYTLKLTHNKLKKRILIIIFLILLYLNRIFFIKQYFSFYCMVEAIWWIRIQANNHHTIVLQYHNWISCYILQSVICVNTFNLCNRKFSWKWFTMTLSNVMFKLTQREKRYMNITEIKKKKERFNHFNGINDFYLLWFNPPSCYESRVVL